VGIRIKCHGCGKVIDAIVLTEKHFNKNIARSGQNPIYPAFRIIQLTNHKIGLLKGKCNRSGRKFKVKGIIETEDVPGYEHFITNPSDAKRRDIQ